jgi:hypothetical protein
MEIPGGNFGPKLPPNLNAGPKMRVNQLPANLRFVRTSYVGG